jgi:pimeloyl-ACP methyl ester carboxylesterase
METFDRVTSPDGTPIAFWAGGDGTPLLLVHGAMSDHTRWGPLLPRGQDHVGDVLPPEVFADAVVPFLREP